jgi:hypothetical protein
MLPFGNAAAPSVVPKSLMNSRRFMEPPFKTRTEYGASGLCDPNQHQLLEIDFCLPMAPGCQFL